MFNSRKKAKKISRLFDVLKSTILKANSEQINNRAGMDKRRNFLFFISTNLKHPGAVYMPLLEVKQSKQK